MAPGPSIAHYRLTTKLGEGGMGAVYRATDTKLNRDVAVKILPDAFAADPDRLARFTREAQVLAQLNHPNIATIYGVEERAIILELVEGADLKGPLSAEEALPIIEQLIDALEYAHEKGIVHRDLKPANLKLTPDRRLKVLDFGLAKALSSDSAQPSADPAASPTLTMRATMAGVIMGTAAYMSPEQARGQLTDKRADIWSFGVVVYELLTGRQLFDGPTVSDTLAAVLTRDPDVSAVPPRFRKLLAKCLTRDSRQRLRDISGARLLLEEEPTTAAPTVEKARRPLIPWIAAAAGLLLGAASVIFDVRGRRATSLAPVVRFELPMFDNASLPTIEISPDGRTLAFAAVIDGTRKLWIRPLDSLAPRALAGTEGATYPTWSPDSASIAFFADHKLKRVAVTGGPLQEIAPCGEGRGAAWGSDGIVYAPEVVSGLFRTSISGEKPEPLTHPKAGTTDRFPTMIAGTNSFVYLHQAQDPETSGVYFMSVKGGEASRILPDDTSIAYLPGASAARGWLIFSRNGGVLAQPFDPAHGRLAGDAVQIAESISAGGNSGKWAFSASLNGTVVVRPAAASVPVQLAWVDRAGKRLANATAPALIGSFSLSPDRKRLALLLTSNGKNDIWLQDVDGGTPVRFTLHEVVAWQPVWSPDGRWIAWWYRGSDVHNRLYRKAVDGSLKEELLYQQFLQFHPSDWSRDGKFLILANGATGALSLLPMDNSVAGPREPLPYAPGSDYKRSPVFSPDSRWVAYVSGPVATNDVHVFVEPLPATGPKWQVSPGVGTTPKWRADGRELYYVSGDHKLMAVPVDSTSGAFHAGAQQSLFDIPALPNLTYEPSVDGQRFLVPFPVHGEPAATPLDVILNWPSTQVKP
jgi:Tol biopolymer transport system component